MREVQEPVFMYRLGGGGVEDWWKISYLPPPPPLISTWNGIEPLDVAEIYEAGN